VAGKLLDVAQAAAGFEHRARRVTRGVSQTAALQQIAEQDML